MARILLKQKGAALLVAIVFLMVAGAIFASSIVGLFSSSSIGLNVEHNADVALATARRGLLYGVYAREQTSSWSTALGSRDYATVTGITPSSCTVTVSESVPGSCASSCYFTISSLASCFSSTDTAVMRRLAMRMRATYYSSTTLASYAYQPVPGSLADVTLNPNYGSTLTGGSVTIQGIGFTGTTLVSFGTDAGTLGTITDTSIVVTSPAHAAGAVDVAITTPEGVITFPSAYTYQ